MSDGCNRDDTHSRVRKAEEIFDRYGNEIRAVIEYNVTDKAGAEDVFHDFFVSVVKKPVPPGIENVRAYVYKALANDIVDRSRRARTRKEGVKQYARHRRGGSVAKEPQDIAIEAEQMDLMLRLIENHLPPREARAIVERYGVGPAVCNGPTQPSADSRSVSRYLTEAIKTLRNLVMDREEVPE